MPDVDVSETVAIPIGALHGSAFGGQQGIYNSHVYLMKASAAAYGGAGISILTASGNTYADTTVLGTPANPAYYTTTDIAGGFNLTGDYTCSYNATTPASSDQLYIYSVGGVDNYLPANIAGTGTNNPMIGLMAVLGSCPSTGTFAGNLSYIYVNEVSTVAAAYALAGFASDGHSIGSGGSALAKQGLANAFANANQLYDIQGSTPGHEARQVTPGTGITGTVPQALLDTLGNILATCVNQTPTPVLPPTSGACQTLYKYTGNAPDTAAAAVYIAKHPGSNVAPLYALQPTIVQFFDDLPAQPNDFSVGINFSGTGLATPVDVAIDAGGDAWVTSSAGRLSKFTPLGVHAAGSPFNVPTANYTAIDQAGNAWTTSSGSNAVYEMSNAGVAVAGTPYTNGDYFAPAGIAIDGIGDTFFANPGGGKVLYGLLGATGDVQKISGSGSSATTTTFADVVVGTLFNELPLVSQVAVDGAGNVWNSGDTFNCTVLLFCYGQNVVRVSGSNFTPSGLSLTTEVAVITCILSCNGQGTPQGIAADSGNNAWVAVSGTTDKLEKVSSTGGTANYTGGGLSTPQGVAVDGNNNVWVANAAGNSVSEFTSAGVATAPAGYSGGTMSVPTNLDIDGSGDVWIVNSTGNSVTELIGAAVPVIRPLASAAALNKLGTMP